MDIGRSTFATWRTPPHFFPLHPASSAFNQLTRTVLSSLPRPVQYALGGSVLIITLAFLCLVWWVISFALAWLGGVRATASVLSRDEIAFLATDRVTTQIVVSDDHAGNSTLEIREGHLIAKVRYYFGIDLNSLPSDAIRSTASGIVVHVPEPTFLEVVIDPNYVLLTKVQSTQLVKDYLTNASLEADLCRSLEEKARQLARDEKHIPTRDAIVARLNRAAPFLEAQVGRHVQFE
jgi:hypothetical protein